MQQFPPKRWSNTFGCLLLSACLLLAVEASAQTIDPVCESYAAWLSQSNPRTDATGMNNRAYPEYNATYWSTVFNLPLGSTVIVKGQYPRARYMALQVYDSERNVLDAISDLDINPDPGQNNPYRSGFDQGHYTIRLVFGRKPLRNPPANTIYTGTLTNVGLIYRIYYANNPDDLPGGPVNPALPDITVAGVPWASCPPRPILPEEATLSGRLDNIDFIGTAPANKPNVPPTLRWQFSVTNPFTPYFPSQDNSYMSTIIGRDLLISPNSVFDMVVLRLKAPTFTNTQAGVPPYAPANMRFWSICQNELLTTSVVRCIPDNAAATINGYATFVISDPSKRPSDAVLNAWGARWLPWGALLPGDVIYDVNGNALSNADGVFYYGRIIYRQTQASPGFPQSVANIAMLPIQQRQAAMGEYWPVIGYCKAAVFEAFGAECIGRQQ